jgi:DNA sulfur modification protein DndC
MKPYLEIMQDIQSVYLRDKRPWIVAFSGGKDSTALLQFTYTAISNLPEKKRHKEIHVVCSDTKVESPNIMSYIDRTIELVNRAAYRDKIPLYAVKVSPTVQDRFFVKIIGRGYPAPNRWFRWCTDKMKIKPANAYIKTCISKYGEVIILLGVRHAEGRSRSGSIKDYRKNGTKFNHHSTLKNAWVYCPIKNLSTEDLWAYLDIVSPPWGGDNFQLVTLYKQANAGECPLVVDRSTPTCGGSRFGCWTCTVVRSDKSMEGFIEAGEEWMKPLLEFRNWLSVMRNNTSPGWREEKRRNGEKGPGPFTLKARKKIFEGLMQVEIEVGFTLITGEEKDEINRLWKLDGYRGEDITQVEARVKKKQNPRAYLEPIHVTPVFVGSTKNASAVTVDQLEF